MKLTFQEQDNQYAQGLWCIGRVIEPARDVIPCVREIFTFSFARSNLLYEATFHHEWPMNSATLISIDIVYNIRI